MSACAGVATARLATAAIAIVLAPMANLAIVAFVHGTGAIWLAQALLVFVFSGFGVGASGRFFFASRRGAFAAFAFCIGRRFANTVQRERL
jgi:hypothetical protein